MIRFLWVLIFSLSFTGAASAQALSNAMDAVRAKDWAEAERLVRRQDEVVRDIVEWHRLRAGEGTSRETVAFLARRPDWPGLPYLRRQMEDSFEDAPNERVIGFFGAQDPRTAEGALAYARALKSSGQSGAAEAEIVLAWRTMAMSESLQAEYLADYGRVLRDHHEARLDYALWKGWKENAQRMYPLVSDGWRKLAAARLALRLDRTGVDVLIEAIPQLLANDPGLAYERFQWRARKGRSDSAIELLVAQSKAGNLGEALPWAGRRQTYARSQMRAGNHRLAYQIAINHGLVEGSKYADLEWLAGYIALRFLDKPKTALQHFVRFEQAVATPISWGRAGYWIGRTYEALGDKASAQRAYAGGGQHQTSFYGLLAAEKAGVPIKPELAGARATDWRGAPFTRSSVHQAALALLKAGEMSLAERFWTHLAETQDRGTMAQMGQMAIDMGQPHIAVMLGKRFIKFGQTIHAPYYPLHPMAKRRNLSVPAEMALSIARRESEFDPVVVSGANAQGLMQILPGTAKQVAGALGIAYSKPRLLSDPEYNVTLGTAYLAGLADEFDGNVIMVAAGYNAGPSRPTRWMSERGDPRRRGGMDIIDWIEHIPFNETRNYVMRVAESLPIYRARLGKNPLPVPFSKELVGRSLLTN
ncbi:lytic transglycosylase domain-containing protein [Cognatishimia activa]|uniref:Soluble lytic murein transglycosylase n=1 Tax=Cognatishimia activa TaxID=1715691 RepID=A0A0P1IL43_9RHOB|nr:lytic transglycosylase domain-containing protein [Cognatishimia activa]CUI54463.1 Soluble lytic murein transglycosylase precursor [Cognatishimia activa]CUK24334.1 Soluble lytic murein transglycosylase precursor [Cognatishimia activa]